MLKLNTALSKEIGEAKCGFHGVSVSLEVELEPGLISQPERLNEQIRHLFGLARTAVEEELNGDGRQEKRATDDAVKRELLEEAVQWDDLNDRFALISDDADG